MHNPSYDFNDELIPLGSTLWVKLVQRWWHRLITSGEATVRPASSEREAGVLGSTMIYAASAQADQPIQRAFFFGQVHGRGAQAVNTARDGLGRHSRLKPVRLGPRQANQVLAQLVARKTAFALNRLPRRRQELTVPSRSSSMCSSCRRNAADA